MNENNVTVFIGIAGASASGKSLIAKTIYDELILELGNNHIAILNEDAYYKDQSHMSVEARQEVNYDHPSALDHDLLVAHLHQLNAGQSVSVPQYCYKTHTRKKETTYLSPKKVIILEGILLLTVLELRELINISIFIDTPLDVCLSRRLLRDVEDRGRSMKSVVTQYLETVRPMFLQFIEPSKQYADLIVPKGGKNRIAIDILKANIREILQY